MNYERRSIPGLHIKKSGNKKHHIKSIMGDIKLPCWEGYYLYHESYKLMKGKVMFMNVEELAGISHRIKVEKISIRE